MIIQELAKYYDRLVESGVDLPIPGFSVEKIHYAVVIDRSGNLVQVNNLQEPAGKKMRPRMLKVPAISRTSGVKPAFLWDKAEYVFGVVPKDKKRIQKDEPVIWEITEKSLAKFEAFKEYHTAILKEKACTELEGLVSFLETWNPKNFGVAFGSDANEMVGGNFIFQLKSDVGSYIHQKDHLVEYWQNTCGNEKTISMRCLVSGRKRSVAVLHKGIKNVPGAQTSGAPIISFNKESFCSYGKNSKDQSLNSPISESIAFSYTTVLNHLLSKDSRQKVQIADTTTLFWAEKKTVLTGFLSTILNPQKDDGYDKQVDMFLQAAKKGGIPEDIDTDTRFFILGLSPNAARLSIRFWNVDSVGNISRNLGRHFEDIEMVRNYNSEKVYPGIWHLLIETAPLKDTKNIPPNLSGPMLIAILKGTRYPASMMSLLLTRMRSDKSMSYYRASIIKGILNRNYKKEVNMSLDRERADVPYLMGRLFAMFEKIQEESHGSGKINATIKDRYFGSASTNPGVVFPQLVRLSQNHQKKLKAEKPGLAITREKELQEIINNIEKFPTFLQLQEQGLFAIGYYHQRQNFFTKKEPESNQE